MLSDDEYAHRATYFGVFPAAQAARISQMLDGLAVRYEFVVQVQSEERLRAWMAWASDGAVPHHGHELFIHSDDLDTVGERILELYPERQFGSN